MFDDTLYILMRTDLASMSHGRAAAQASHASNAFIHKFGKDLRVQEWQKQTKQGFGTAIILGVCESELDDLMDEKLSKFKIKGRVLDPEYGIETTWEIFNLIDTDLVVHYYSSDDPKSDKVTFFREEITCAYVFGSKAELADVLGEFKLY